MQNKRKFFFKSILSWPVNYTYNVFEHNPLNVVTFHSVLLDSILCLLFISGIIIVAYFKIMF